MRGVPISVCMATYNGEKYIYEQITSILDEFETHDDELIIVDDDSKDNTLEVISLFRDTRIKVYKNDENIGVNKSFERGLKLTRNEHIFLSDQDDIWVQGRVGRMLIALNNPDCLVVSGNQVIFPEDVVFSRRFKQLLSKDSKSDFCNFIKVFLGNASYFGCTMAINRKILKHVLPFPNYLESHDLWIIMIAILLSKNTHIEDIVLKRRIHGNNVSIVERDIAKKLYSRLILIISLLEFVFRRNEN